MKPVNIFSDDVKIHSGPPRSVRIVFYVDNPATKEVLVEKSQLVIELGIDPLTSLTVAELARDHHAEIVAMLDAAKGAATLTDAQRAENQDRSLRRKVVEEFMVCAGDMIQRFVRLKLREWARREIL